MSLPPSRPCPHEPRPGTTVCLHCRREARTATRSRRRKLAIRALLTLVAVSSGLTAIGGLVFAVVSARPERALAFASGVAADVRSRIRDLGERAVASPAPTSLALAAPVMRVVTEDAARLPAVLPSATVPPAPPLPPTPPVLPIVGQGATRLRDSVVAIRRGDSVTVHFDTPKSRTRRPDKFEQIVRSTLPAIYGPIADSVLVRIPAGDLARGRDLFTDLPTRGLHLSLGDGWALALWPATRPGQDGPLVVMYRAMVTKLR
jgi:hypothetical protein